MIVALPIFTSGTYFVFWINVIVEFDQTNMQILSTSITLVYFTEHIMRIPSDTPLSKYAKFLFKLRQYTPRRPSTGTLAVVALISVTIPALYALLVTPYTNQEYYRLWTFCDCVSIRFDGFRRTTKDCTCRY
jgi:hypothetical protein